MALLMSSYYLVPTWGRQSAMQWGITNCFLRLGDFALLSWSAVDKSVGFIYWVKYLFCLFGLQMGKLCNWNVFYAGEWLLFKEKMKKIWWHNPQNQNKIQYLWIWNSSTFHCLGWCEGRTCKFFWNTPWSRSAVYWFITDFLFFLL